MSNNQRGGLWGVWAGAYAFLIFLLMLTNCHGCDNESRPGEQPHDQSNETAEERAEEIGGSGDIKITALWDFPGDVDLHLMQPNGNEIWFRNMKDRRTGAELDVDNIPGGRGSAENIFVENPPAGTYTVSLVLYNISSEAPHGGTVKVVVNINGESEVLPVRLSYDKQQVDVKRFDYTPRR